MIKWFSASKLGLNLYKIDIKRFITNSAPHSALHIGCKENCKYKISCLQISKHLNWENHKEQIIPELNGAYCAVIFIVHISNVTNFIQFISHTFILL